MTAAKVTGWPGFKYEPVYEVQARLAARQLRVARNNIRRLLDTMGLKYSDLAERLRVLRKDSRLNTAQKRNQFQTILDIYAKRITEGQTAIPATEAAPVGVAGELLALPDSGSASTLGGPSPESSGTGADADAGISELAVSDDQ